MLVEETEKIREVALEYPEWSPREVGVHLADACGFTASESTVYRILKQAGWVTPLVKKTFPASSAYRTKTTHANQMRQPMPPTCW